MFQGSQLYLTTESDALTFVIPKSPIIMTDVDCIKVVSENFPSHAIHY